ncbi:MAG: hypothetical protein U9R21_01825 [Candidatus Thermoplasmatota archaeon]|nr:hypothetical protein [Candidatus Thermoplasmatota archaeon]
MDAGSVILGIFVIILLVLLLYVGIKLIRISRGRKKALAEKYGYLPDHTELYFEEYFPSLISEWDLITKPKLERWKKGIQGKLKTIGGDIDEILDYRKNLNSRISKLEKEVGKLEQK